MPLIRKRKRCSRAADSGENVLEVGSHPNGVQPLGNMYNLGPNAAVYSRADGLGSFAVFSDELILAVLGLLSGQDVCRVSQVSRAMHVFSRHDELWRDLVLADIGARFTFGRSWRHTFISTNSKSAEHGDHPRSPATNGLTNAPAMNGHCDGHAAAQNPKTITPTGNGGPPTSRRDSCGTAPAPDTNAVTRTAEIEDQSQENGCTTAPDKNGVAGEEGQAANGRSASGALSKSNHEVVVLRNFFSDVLFQPWFCASLEIDPRWLQGDNIDRRSNLSVAHFVAEYELPNRPVVITDIITKWPAFQTWTPENLIGRFGDAEFDVAGYKIRLEDYFAYARENRDDMPLYIFDKKFAEKAPPLADEFSVPEYFSDDLFAVLGKDRPDYRWLIIGPRRSGSTFHKDPNSTSAWNACIRGAKKWIMFPPGKVPPGVHPSKDESEVTTPVSLIEWFYNFYFEARKLAPIECVVREGELMFVPRGWWHIVLNLEPSIAVTQNYVGAQNVGHVMEFLRTRPDQVSGCADRETLHDRFRVALGAARPDMLEKANEFEAAKACKAKSKSVWNSIKPATNQEAAGFSFGF